MRTRLFTIGLATAMLSTPAFATSEQWLTRYAPPTSPESSVGRISETDSAVKRPDAEKGKLIIKSLKGVVFVGAPTAVKKRGASATGIIDSSGSVPEEAKTAASAYVGKPVTLGDLDQLSRDLVLAFRNADRPVVNVVVPEQEVSNGVLQILVVVGKLGNVKIEGATPQRANRFKSEVHLVPGQPISEATLLDDLRYFNRNPFRNVAAIYQPGKAFGQTDVELQVNQPKNWQVYGGVETKGDKGPLGTYRPFVGATATDLLGFDEVFGYQFSWAKDLKSLRSHVLSFNLPLPGRFQFEALYGHTDTSISATAPLAQKGSSDVAGLYLRAPLPHFGRLSHDLRVGAEYKRDNNNVDFGGTSVFKGNAAIAHGLIGYTGEMVSWLGVTKFDGNVYLSPGGVVQYNNTTAFATQRANTKASYTYARLTVDNRTDLPGDWRIATTATGQVSNTPLLPSEMLTFGGIGSVRGFVYGKARADSGYIANLTVYTPALGLLSSMTSSTAFLDRMRLYAFIDTGAGWNVQPAATEFKSMNLTGSGIGLSYELASNASIDVGYGWKLNQSNAGQSSNGAFHLRAVVRY